MDASKVFRMIVLVLVMSTASACSSRFTKLGATELEWERDSQQCARGASSGFYDRCLEARGWVRQ